MRSATVFALACAALLVAPASAAPRLYAGTLQMSIYGGAGFAAQYCPADFQADCDGAQFNTVVRDNGVFTGQTGPTSYGGALFAPLLLTRVSALMQARPGSARHLAG